MRALPMFVLFALPAAVTAQDAPLGSASWIAESNQDGAQFGFSLAGAGDVNGDGFHDLIVGAPYLHAGETNEGGAFVFLGSPEGLGADPAWATEGNQANGFLGFCVSWAGDANGDGFDDVLVGAPQYSAGHANEGRAFLFFGSAAGLGEVPAWTGESDQVDAYFGYSVSRAGDVNADGLDDVIIGAYGYDAAEINEGRAFVFLGGPLGLESDASWTAGSNQAFSAFSSSVAGGCDVNGDDFDDVIIGAALFDGGETNEGRAFAYLGSPDGLEVEPAWSAESDQPFSFFGNAVACAGDVNNDGFDDVLVGAYDYSAGEAAEGRVFVYLGSGAGLSAEPAWMAESNQVGAAFGLGLSGAGDVNADGFDDALVGATMHDGGELDEGAAFLYLGSAQGLEATPAWAAEPDQASAYFGRSLSGAGDLNGDGFEDVAVGAEQFDSGEPNEGRAYSYLGACLDGDLCAGGGICRAATCDATACLVGGTWYEDGQANPAVDCESCVPLSAPMDWTADPDGTACSGGLCRSGACDGAGCMVDGVWYEEADANPLADCQSCVPASTQVAWTDDPDGTLCTDGLCRSGICDGSSCLIDGSWFEEGEEGPQTECQWCAPDTSRVEWTDRADGTECAAGLCRSGACDPSACFVDRTWHGDRDRNPVNACQSCVADVSRVAWTNDSEGTACPAGLCRGGACDADRCFIRGEWYEEQVGNPINECEWCFVSANRTNWTMKTDGEVCSTGLCREGVCDTLHCLIDGRWFTDGDAKADNGCASCAVVSSRSSWTDRPDGSPCDDADELTVHDSCNGGLCTGAPVAGEGAELDAGVTAGPDSGVAPRPADPGCSCALAPRRVMPCVRGFGTLATVILLCTRLGRRR